MLKSSKKNKKDKNAVEDEIETLPVEDVWNIVFYLPFLKKPNIAPPFDDEEVDAMIEEMEEEEVSPLVYYDGEWEADLTLEIILPAVGSEFSHGQSDQLLVPVSDIRLPGSVRAVVLDFFNCNSEGTGTDPEMLWNFLPHRDQLAISLPIYLKRYWLSQEHILASLNMQDSYISFTNGAHQLIAWCRNNMLEDKGAVDVVRVISRHHVLVAHVLESRRNRRRESLLVRKSVGSKWIVHWLVGSVDQKEESH